MFGGGEGGEETFHSIRTFRSRSLVFDSKTRLPAIISRTICNESFLFGSKFDSFHLGSHVSASASLHPATLRTRISDLEVIPEQEFSSTQEPLMILQWDQGLMHANDNKDIKVPITNIIVVSIQFAGF